MRRVAKEMTNLTSVLEHLHEILSDCYTIASHNYLQGIESVIRGVQVAQDELFEMIENKSIFRRLRWAGAKRILADVEAHKNTISMQIVILTLAAVKKNSTTYVKKKVVC